MGKAVHQDRRIIRFPVMPTIAMLVAVSILITLGIWQVQRLHWKAAILQALDAAYATQNVKSLAADDFAGAYKERRLFVYGRITGEFLPQWQMMVGPRTHDGVTGYHLYVPFRMDSGGAILVNRGWVPDHWKGPRPDVATEHATIEGLARNPDRANLFTPPNDPFKDLWFSVDLAQVEKWSGQHLEPYILYANKTEEDADIYPIGLPHDWRPDNNHMQYALFWFGMAGVLVIVYAIRFYK